MNSRAIEQFREWSWRYRHGEFVELALCTEEEILEAHRAAAEWLAGRRFSTTTVAAHYLRDGYCHI